VAALAGREKVPRQTGRTAPRSSVPACRSRAAVWPAPGIVVQAPGLDNAGTGPVRAVLSAAGGLRAVGGDAAVMAEQASSELAGLLRQLRAEAQLTQQELAKAAGVSPRSVSDLERGINRTARQDTAVRLAGALGLRCLSCPNRSTMSFWRLAACTLRGMRRSANSGRLCPVQVFLLSCHPPDGSRYLVMAGLLADPRWPVSAKVPSCQGPSIIQQTGFP
jgi:DNA-binding XRE family transcriptional regulator